MALLLRISHRQRPRFSSFRNSHRVILNEHRPNRGHSKPLYRTIKRFWCERGTLLIREPLILKPCKAALQTGDRYSSERSFEARKHRY